MDDEKQQNRGRDAAGQDDYESRTEHDDWQHLGTRFGDAFRASLNHSRPTFEFVRMILTTALVVGLARYTMDNAGGSLVDITAIAALWMLALLLTLMTAETAFSFCALVGVVLANRLKVPYWKRAIHLFLGAVTIAMLLAILAIGSQEAHKAASRAPADTQAMKAK